MRKALRRELSASQGEAGASAVEFALVMIPLFLLLFGIIQFGLAYNRQQGMHAGTREAARIASIGSTVGAIESAFDNTVNTIDFADVELRIFVIDDPVDDPDGSLLANPAVSDRPCSGQVRRVRIESRIEPGSEDDYAVTIPLWGSRPMSFPSDATFVCEPRATAP